MPDLEKIKEAKNLVCELRKVWERKTDRPLDSKVKEIQGKIVEAMKQHGYPRWAKDIQSFKSPAHHNVLIDNEESEYWIGVLEALKYVAVDPPTHENPYSSIGQNPFQFLNFSAQEFVFKQRIRIYRKNITQECDKCGYIGPYYYPRISMNNKPCYKMDENGNYIRDDKGKLIPTNERYIQLRTAWMLSNIKNICPKCWENGKGILVPCSHTWMNEISCNIMGEDNELCEIPIQDFSPSAEDILIAQNIIDRFVMDRWVKLGSREHELLTILLKFPDPDFVKNYKPQENDPILPATMVIDDPQYGPTVSMCLVCVEECKNGIIGIGKCRNYQMKLAEYYGTTQTCMNQYRKRIVAKLKHFCTLHRIDISI